jgi:hypothetical protein
VARHGSLRPTQRALNGVLAMLGHNLPAHNEDGDHVRDLGFGGTDTIDNYWPLDSVVNRLAYNGWRSLYLLNYKKKQNRAGHWLLEKAPLNSGTLVGKHFHMTGTNAVAIPQAGVAAGSSVAWGNAGTVLANNGGQIAEA